MARHGIITGIVVPFMLSIVPGWGHIWVRRSVRGLFLFLAFFGALDYALITTFTAPEGALPTYTRLAFGFCAALVVFTFGDIARITIWLQGRKVQGRRDALLSKTVVHYLRGEHAQALEAIERMLRIDPRDVSALFYLGMVQRAAGRRGRALHAFQRALKADEGGMWTSDLRRELEITSASADTAEPPPRS